MNTKIKTSFGLVLLMAVGVIATMVALGMFPAKPASADVGTATVTVTPSKARSIAEYKIVVTTPSDIEVGETITVKFNTSTGVPSSIAASAVKLKATEVGPPGAGNELENQLVNAAGVSVSGKSVTITVPDMDPGTVGNSIGDNNIEANATITITFSQAAGIQNPNLAKEDADDGVVDNTPGYTLDVSSTADSTAVPSTKFDITRFTSFTPSTGGARGLVVAVSGGGFEKNCADCKIRLNPNLTAPTAPTTGNEGSGSIDPFGVFTGEFTVDASTNKVGWFIWVVDSTGTGKAATTAWVQKAGATPTAAAYSPGQKVSVDLVDFTATANLVVWGGILDPTVATNSSVTIGSFGAVSSNVIVVPTSGSTASLTPFKFVVPSSMPSGTHKVTIRESGAGTKTASFTILVASRVLTVVPANAAPGQQVTITGTGFNKTAGQIQAGALTAKNTGGTFALNAAIINIGTTGQFDFSTTLPTANAFAGESSDAITIAASDGSVSGSSTSSGFSRTKRTLTLTPATASPGESVTVAVTGMTVDNNETGNTQTAKFKISWDGLNAFPGTIEFAINSNGEGTGVVTIPTGTLPGSFTFTATDNANLLNTDAGPLGRTATAKLTVPPGVVSVDTAKASTGQIITVSGSAFPPNSVGTALTFSGANAIPVGGFTSDGNGDFSVPVEVPPASSGGSLTPGTQIISVTIGGIIGTTTAFAIANPSITITPPEAAVEDTIIITGTGFSSLVTVDRLNIGGVSVMPSPAPRAARNGDVTATVLVPLFNPGTYVVVMETGGAFSATATFKAIASGAAPVAATDKTEDIFTDVIANSDNLVRVWRFSNATQDWDFFDPRPAFEQANTLLLTGAGDILWVNVNTEQDFAHQQGNTLVPGWNLIVLK